MTTVVPVAITPAALPLPDPADRATFSARKLEQLRWANNEYSTGSKALADASLANALDAQASAVAGALSAGDAAAQAAIALAAANFNGIWSGLTGALAKPASVFHSGAFWVLLNNLADVTASQPGVSADWQVAGGAFPVVAINSLTVAQPYKTYLFYGNCTLTLPAITGNAKQLRIIVLAGVTAAIVAPAGADKIRSVAGSMTVDAAPFDKILTDAGATYGWV